MDPKLGTMEIDRTVVKSDICRQIYVARPKRFERNRSLFPDLKKTKDVSEGKEKRLPTKRKSAKVDHSISSADSNGSGQLVQDFLNSKQCDMINLTQIFIEECLMHSNEGHQRQTKKLFSFDEYFGLSDWNTFYGSLLRPGNFGYSKMYSGLSQLMVNTTNDILGLRFDLGRNNLGNFRLYQNDQPQQIEDFCCNGGVLDLVVKHMNKEYLRIFDCKAQKYKTKIKLDNDYNSNGQSVFTLKNSQFKMSFSQANTEKWVNLDKRNTILKDKFKKTHLDSTISEIEPESFIEDSSDGYMNLGILLNQIEREPRKNIPIGQYLEQDGSYIYYFDNFFNVQVFDQRLKKRVLSRRLRKGTSMGDQGKN
jgi:hypothetical protein